MRTGRAAEFSLSLSFYFLSLSFLFLLLLFFPVLSLAPSFSAPVQSAPDGAYLIFLAGEGFSPTVFVVIVPGSLPPPTVSAPDNRDAGGSEMTTTFFSVPVLVLSYSMNDDLDPPRSSGPDLP